MSANACPTPFLKIGRVGSSGDAQFNFLSSIPSVIYSQSSQNSAIRSATLKSDTAGASHFKLRVSCWTASLAASRPQLSSSNPHAVIFSVLSASTRRRRNPKPSTAKIISASHALRGQRSSSAPPYPRQLAHSIAFHLKLASFRHFCARGSRGENCPQIRRPQPPRPHAPPQRGTFPTSIPFTSKWLRFFILAPPGIPNGENRPQIRQPHESRPRASKQ
jgi:hypothetical protein